MQTAALVECRQLLGVGVEGAAEGIQLAEEVLEARRSDDLEDPAGLLEELYSYYRRAGDMIEKLLRDEAAEVLLGRRGLRLGARARVRAALGHAVAFSTWQELTGPQGLDDEDAAELM